MLSRVPTTYIQKYYYIILRLNSLPSEVPTDNIMFVFMHKYYIAYSC